MTIETPAVGRRTVLGAAVGAAALTSGPALAAAPPDILVGAVYPLSGNAAPIGKALMALAVDIGYEGLV